MTTNIKSLLELAQNPKIYMACHKHKTTVGRKGIVLKCKRTNVYTNLHNLCWSWRVQNTRKLGDFRLLTRFVPIRCRHGSRIVTSKKTLLLELVPVISPRRPV
jgi:hypothetical protein